MRDAGAPDETALVGTWVHAHEEDREGVQVFVPAGTELPPSRGRAILRLAADHSASTGLPGPADRGVSTGGGAWRLGGDVLHVRCPGWVAAYQVVAHGSDRVELRPVPAQDADV